MVKDIISLVRPQQWLKNVFIFLPIFFSRKLGDGACLSSALIAFVIYCLVAGSIYCLNDICDRESDRLHPTKCRRPIASGIVSVGAGYGIMALLLVLAIALTFVYDSTVRHVLLINVGIYFILNIAYCFWLKHIALVDVFVISIGFVLRVLAGGVVTGYRGRLLHYVYCITGGDRKNGDLQSLSDYDMGFGWNLTLFAVDSGR